MTPDEGSRVRRQVAAVRARFPREPKEDASMNHKIPNFAQAAQQAERAAQQDAMIQHNLDVIAHQAQVRAFEVDKMEAQRRALIDDAAARADRHALERQILELTLASRDRELTAREAEVDYWRARRAALHHEDAPTALQIRPR